MANRPGKGQTGRTGKDGGGLMNALSAMFGGSGITGGDFIPAGEGEGSINAAEGISGVEGKPQAATISRATVNHPVLDTLTGGRGNALASQINSQAALQQLTGIQGLDQMALRNSGELATTQQMGKNALAQTQEQGNQARLTGNAAGEIEKSINAQKSDLSIKEATHKAALSYMATIGAPYSDEGYQQAVQQVTPAVIANAQKSAQNQNITLGGEQRTLMSPEGQKGIASNTMARLAEPAASNMLKTKMLAGPNETGIMSGGPLSDTNLTLNGAKLGGTQDQETVERDPNNPLKVTTTKRVTSIPGTPGFANFPLKDAFEEFQRQKQTGIQAPVSIVPPVQSPQVIDPLLNYKQYLQTNPMDNTGIQMWDPEGKANFMKRTIPRPLLGNPFERQDGITFPQ